jgi:hypothetical protein
MSGECRRNFEEFRDAAQSAEALGFARDVMRALGMPGYGDRPNYNVINSWKGTARTG